MSHRPSRMTTTNVLIHRSLVCVIPSRVMYVLTRLVTVATAATGVAKRTSISSIVSVTPFKKVLCTSTTCLSTASRPRIRRPAGLIWFQSSVANALAPSTNRLSKACVEGLDGLSHRGLSVCTVSEAWQTKRETHYGWIQYFHCRAFSSFLGAHPHTVHHTL